MLHLVSSCSPPDPPGFPRIQDESGRRLEGPIGPYEDGTAVRMMCLSSGGKYGSALRVAVTAGIMGIYLDGLCTDAY